MQKKGNVKIADEQASLAINDPNIPQLKQISYDDSNKYIKNINVK